MPAYFLKHHPNLSTTTNTPNFALDVGQMGGMYAGKIFLVGTENGLGVRNAGSINATAGQLILSANGDLMNTGNVIANKDQVQINAKNVKNSGNISSAISEVTLQSQNLDNSGLISSADELHLKQSGQTKNAGKINAARIALEANQLINTGSIQQTGSQALDLQAADISNKAGKIGAIEFTGTGTGGTGSTNPNQPNAEAPANQAKDGGSLEVIDTSDLPVKTFEKGFIHTAQSLNNDGGKIEANGGIDLKTQLGLDNTSGQLHLGNLDVRGDQFINQSGQLIVDQANIQTLSINNEKGSLFANQGLDLNSQSFNNKDGKVQALDAIHIQNTGELNNQQGLIAAQQSIDLKTGQLNNTQGTLYSEKNNIKIQAQDHINNTSGIIQASGNTDIHAKSLNNQQGQLLANDLNIQLKAQLDNTQGQIQAKKTLTFASQNLSNDQGQISAEHIQLNQQNKLMNSGTIYAEQYLKIENSHTVNQGLIASGKDTSILSKNLTSSKGSTLAAGLAVDGKLKEAGDLTVQVDTAVINGNVFAGKAVVIQAKQDLDVSEAIIHVQEVELNSKEGSIITQKAKIQAKNTAKIDAKQQLNNQDGQLIADTLSLKGSSLNNQSGIIQQTGESQLDLSFADSIHNQAGQIAANAAQLNIQAGTLNNESGQISHAGQNGLTIHAQQIDAAQGKIVSNAHLNIDAKKINLNQAQTQAHQIKIMADQLSHQQGQMVQTGQLSAAQLHIQNTLDNSHGSILSNHGLEISAKQLENQKGILQSAQDQSMSIDIAELFNNTEGKVLSGQDLNIQAQTLNNQNAQLQAVNQLNLKVVQQLNNQQGLIAAQKQLAIQANQLNNTQGQIASLDDQVHLELSSINNSSGLVQSGTSLKIQANSIDNQQGKLIAQQDVNLNSQNAALLNQSGQVSAGQNIQIFSHGLNNDTGLIQAGKNLSIDSQNQDLSNQQSGTAGGLIAQNELNIKNVQQLNNQQGFIGANTSVDLQAQQVQNQKGQLVSSQNLSIQTSGVAGEINNQEGKIAAQGNMQLHTAKLNNSAISAAGSQIIAAKDLQINADQLLNTNTFSTAAQGIDAENIQIYTQQLDNQQGAIRASDHSTLKVEQQLNNTKGLISALKQLNIQSASKLLNINNQKGQLLAGQTLDLTAQHLSGDGQVISLGDATIELTKTYQHEKDAKLQANGQLHFTTQQDLLNAGDIIAGDVLNIQANNIVNTVDHASLQSKQTLLNAQNNLKNLGLINGDLTVLKAKQIDNEGTGRIYGTQLALQADVLNNRPNSIGVAPVIAARQRLDIGVNILNNNANTADYASQANILSAGDFYLGGALDQNNQATGTAQIVNNTGARIEAFGDMHLSSKHVNNTNANFDAGLVLVSANNGQVKEFRGGWKTFDGLYFGGNPNEDWTVYYYDIEHYETQVKTSAPGVIQAGGNIQFENAESIVNDKSQILAGQILDINSIAVDQSKVLENIGVDGINEDVYKGTQELHYLDGRKDKHKTDYYAWMQKSLSSQPLAVSIAKPFQNLTSSPAVIDQVKADALGIKIEQAASTQGLTKQQENLAEDVALNDKKAVNSNQVDTLKQGATTAQKDQVDVPSAAGTGTEIRAVDNSQFKVPNSALYKVNKDSNAQYLIETDPAFANYKNWLSSDYMLNALGLDPSMQQKRLGDGYYEQRMVQDQIAQLTGHRFLEGYGSDEEQYKALMNNSLSFAKLYGLRPGIALTAAQIAQLTSDIVWLEEKEVTLPDGSKRKALVPQVYVKARVGDLKGDGTLISAETVKINMQGDVLNSAIIAGRNAVVLNADNVNQLNGRIQANDITVKTVKDLNIEGGQIVADHAMQLDVGRDFKLNTTTLSSEHQIGDSYFKQTSIDRVAGLYINSPLKTQSTDTENLKTTISIRVGGNTQMKGAEIANNSGSTLIQTVGNVDVGVVTTEKISHTQNRTNNYGHLEQRETIGTKISSLGDSTITGQNITGQAVSISSQQGNVELFAEKNIQLESGIQQQTLSSKTEGKGSFSGKKLSEYIDQESISKANQLNAGKDIIIHSQQGNITATHLQAEAGNTIQIQADKGNVSLLSAIDEKSVSSTSSKKNAATYNNRQSGYIEQEVAQTTLKAGNSVDINAGKNIELQANDIKADNAIYVGNTLMQRQADGSLKASDGSLMPENVTLSTLETHDQQWDEQQKGYRGIVKELIKTVAVGMKGLEGIPGVKVDSKLTVGESSSKRTEQINQTGSSLTASNVAIGSSGQTTLTSADIAAQNTILSGKKVTLNAAEEQKIFAESHGKETIEGLGVKLNKDNIRLGGFVSEDTTKNSKTTETTHKAGSIQTENLKIQGADGVDILGQNITATGDTVIDHGRGALNIGGYENKTETEEKSHTETISTEVGVRNAYLDAALAVIAVKDAAKALSDAKGAYSQAQRDHAAGKITKEALDDSKANVAMATVNLASAQIAVAASAVAAAASTATYGFTIGANGERIETTTADNTVQGQWQGSNLDLNNLTLKSENQDVNIQGSRLSASGTTTFDGTKDLNVTAGTEHGKQDSSSKTNSQSVSYTYGGGGSASVGKQTSKSQSESLTHVNSQVALNQVAGSLNKLNIQGGEVSIADRGNLQVKEIHVESLQDTASSSNSSKGGNIGAGFGSNGKASNISVGYNQSKGGSNSAWVNDTSKLLIGNLKNDADLDAMGVQKVTNIGGVIANASKNEDGTLTDHGKLNYSGELDLKDIQDHNNNSSSGFNVSTTIGKTTQEKDGQKSKYPNGSTTIGLNSSGQETEQLTKATMGQGTVKNTADSTNRDINNTQEITRDQTTGMLDGSVTVDHRLLSESGRAEIIQQQKNLPQNVEIIGKMTAAGVTSLGVATAALASGDQNLKQAYDTVMNPARTFDFVQKHPEAATIIEQFKNGDYDGILATKGSIQLLAQALGQDVDVLTTSITSFLGIKGAFDHQTNTVVLDVTNGNRSTIVDTFGHEIAHGQGIKNETSADLIGKTVDWAFSSGIKSNQDTIDQYKVQLGDGKNIITQAQNIVELEKDNTKVLDAISDHGDQIDEKTSYWQDIKNLSCWNDECVAAYKNMDAAQEKAYRLGQSKATTKFINDIKHLPNIPKEVYDALTKDPMGTMAAIWDGVKNIPNDVLQTGKTITKGNLVGSNPAEFEKLGNAEMTLALNGLSAALSAGTVTVVKKGATITVEAVKSIKNSYILAKTPEGINFKITQPQHLSSVESYAQKTGITGGHNAIAFYDAVKKYNVKVIDTTSTNIKGITNINYQIPALDRAGNIIGYKSEVKTKTIYDPKVFTDNKILELGQKASINGYKDAMASKNGQATAIVNGISFRIYVNKTTGEVRNFHPN